MLPTCKWIIAVIAINLVPSLGSPPDYRRCPVGCNCSTLPLAVCDTLDFPRFSTTVLKLVIKNPAKPLKLDAKVFSNMNLPSVDTIAIENAKIEKIDSSAFADLPQLVSLSFVNSELPEKIAPDFVVYATSLRQLNIDGTRLVFETIKSESIRQVKLSNCQLNTVKSSMFANMPELTSINLSDNNIEEIAANSFETLFSLEELNLANNKISKLPADIFNNNEELVTLDLSGNPLKTLDSEVLSGLEKLVLSNCMLKEFKGGKFDVLGFLDLSNNSITDISSSAFQTMQDLEYLNLSNNKLKTLPDDIFANNSRLQKIILDHNEFQTLPKFVNNETFETYMFSCSNCGLESLQANTFDYMPALLILRLSNNRIHELKPEVFAKIQSLRVLDLSYNLISKIDNKIFEKNTALTKMNLAGNQISELDPEIFANNGVLKALDVSNNVLKEIWKQPAMRALPSIRTINVANNKLSEITVGQLEVTKRLEVLNINNNKLQSCTYKLREAITWLKNHSVAPVSSDTHEQLINSDVVLSKNENELIWEDIISDICDYEDAFENDDDDDEDDDEDDGGEQTDIDGDEGSTKDFYDQEEISVTLTHIPELHSHIRDRYRFLWPILVFIFTALFVLLLVSNVILCVLRRRGQLPRNINISWRNGHGGFVYKPLTEDVMGSNTIINKRYTEKPSQIAIVHRP